MENDQLEQFYNEEIKNSKATPFENLSAEQKESLRKSFSFARWQLAVAKEKLLDALHRAYKN